MNEKEIKDPAALDLATVPELVRELMNRHIAVVMAVLPESKPGAPAPMAGRVFVNGNYLVCLGLTCKLREYVDKMAPANPQIQEPL